MKKALIVNPYWDTMGGGERYCAFVAKCLLDWQWQVDLLSDHDPRDQLLKKFAVNISSANLVKADVFTSKYRLLFWLSDGSLPTSFAAKTIIHFQFPFTSVNLSLSDKIKTKIYLSVANSAFTKKFIDRTYGFKSFVLYPPVSVQNFRPGPKINQILYVGRFSQLTQKKNHHLLIQGYHRLGTKFSHWKLVIAGGVGVGTDIGYLERLRASSRGGNIEIITNPSLDRLRKLYAQSKIFWSASGFGSDEETQPAQVEHFGISLVEAMSAGCVPLVSNLGGHKEIVVNGTCGYLCDSLDELVRRTRQLCRVPSDLDGLAQNAIARSRLFSEESFKNTFQKLL